MDIEASISAMRLEMEQATADLREWKPEGSWGSCSGAVDRARWDCAEIAERYLRELGEPTHSGPAEVEAKLAAAVQSVYEIYGGDLRLFFADAQKARKAE